VGECVCMGVLYVGMCVYVYVCVSVCVCMGVLYVGMCMCMCV